MLRLTRGTDSEFSQVDQLLMLAFGSASRRNELELYTKVQPDGWYVIEEDDRIVAVGGCIVDGSFSWVGLVGTHPAVRGRGHATRLSEHLAKWSYARGCRTVALDASQRGRLIHDAMLDNAPDRNLLLPFESAYLELLLSVGFVERRRLTHMRHGDEALPGSRHLLLAQTSFAAG